MQINDICFCCATLYL